MKTEINKKKKRIVTNEDLQKIIDHFPEVVMRKEKAAQEIKKVKEHFNIDLKELLNKK